MLPDLCVTSLLFPRICLYLGACVQGCVCRQKTALRGAGVEMATPYQRANLGSGGGGAHL